MAKEAQQGQLWGICRTELLNFLVFGVSPGSVSIGVSRLLAEKPTWCWRPGSWP